MTVGQTHDFRSSCCKKRICRNLAQSVRWLDWNCTISRQSPRIQSFNNSYKTCKTIVFNGNTYSVAVPTYDTWINRTENGRRSYRTASVANVNQALVSIYYNALMQKGWATSYINIRNDRSHSLGDMGCSLSLAKRVLVFSCLRSLTHTNMWP